MKYSLLYAENAEKFKTDCAENFNIPAALSYVRSDTQSLKIFAEILGEPLTGRKDIIYRQDILRDFKANQNIFRALLSLFSEYDGMKDEYNAAQRRLNSRLFSKRAPAEMFFDCLNEKAFYLKRLMGFICEIKRLTFAGGFFADGIKKLRGLCSELTGNAAFTETEELIGGLADMSPESGYGVAARVTESFSVGKFGLISKKKEGPSVSRRRKARAKSDLTEVSFIPLGDEDNIVTGYGVKRLEAVLTCLYKGLYGLFEGYRREMKFYETAIMLTEYLDKRRMPYCFPEISTECKDVFSCDGLYDFSLLAGTQNAGIIEKNSVKGGEGGAVVFGENNCGKTVFLRSLCTARLFAQAGLPVCAKRAEISPKKGIFSLLASAEEKFGDDEAGRFEAEAAKLSGIIENADSGCVFYLNEIFQSTAYDDAAEGLYHILEYLKKVGTSFVCVTHLDNMIEKYRASDGDTVLLTTGEKNYVFEKI